MGKRLIGPKYLKDLLNRKCLTHNELAQLLGVSLSTVNSMLYSYYKGTKELKQKIKEIDASMPDVSELLNGLSVREYIKDFCQRKDITLKEFAALLGVDIGTVKFWKNNLHYGPSRKNLNKMIELDQNLLDVSTILNGLTIIDYINDFCQRKALMQKEIAALLGVSASAIYRWENGISKPSVIYLNKMIKLDRELPDKVTCKNIPEFIKDTLERIGYTSSDLADTLGVSRQAVSLWLNGINKPKGEYLEKIEKLAKEGVKKESSVNLNGSSPAEFIKNMRKKKGILQKELAELIGVLEKTISNWEVGKTVPTDAYLLKIIKLSETLPDKKELISAENVSAYIKDLRVQKGLKQEDLAKILNVSIPLVSCWECSRTKPSEEMLAKIIELKEMLPAKPKQEQVNVQELLDNKGLLQKELANIMGIRSTAVNNWVKQNRLPNEENTIKLKQLSDILPDINKPIADQGLNQEIEILTSTEYLGVKTPLTHPIFKEVVKLLPDYCRNVTTLRLGLYDGKVYDIITISEILGMSEEEVVKLGEEGLFYFKTWLESYNELKGNTLTRHK